MHLARVIGNVHATRKDPNVESAKMLVIVPIDAEKKPCGEPLAAVDMVGAGLGEIVFYTTAYEAVMPWIEQNPQYSKALIDAGIIGIVDRIDYVGGQA